jgi:CheY-like chemotaxis protein
MATRTLLCVEPDSAAFQALTATLAPYGFEFKNIINGDEAVEWGRKNSPVLIIVSVEPKKVGYAICNKLKRSADLKDIPLILTSSEEPPAKFDQHKTFKLRADEYLFKPFDPDELSRKVDKLVGLGASGTPQTEEMFLSSDLLSSEIAIEADDIVDEARIPTPPPGSGIGAVVEIEAETSDSSGMGPSLDAIFDKEAQAAFDALELHETPTVGAPPPAVDPQDDKEESWDEQGATSIAPSSLAADMMQPFAEPGLPSPAATAASMPGMVPAPAPESAPTEPVPHAAAFEAELEFPPGVLREPPEEIGLPPEPDMVLSTSVEALPVIAAPDGLRADLQERIHTLENDNRRLQGELEDMSGRLQAQPFHKERDLLGLRETINRKEKDLLDLRDALDAKERQMLDQKDRIRESERARRDLEEKMLAMEKSLVYASERVTALAQDKDRAVERERALKVRLDDNHLELAKTQDELESLRKRLATAEERTRVDVDKIRLDMENHVADMEQVHRAEIAQLTNERQAAEAAREEQARTEKARMDMDHAAELEAQQRRAADELAALEDRHDVELTRVKREQEKAVASLKEEATAQLGAERQAHEAALEGKERDHKNEIQALRRRLEDELAAAESRRQRELEEAAARHSGELTAADERRRNELQARDEEHHNAVAEMDRRHLDEKTGMSERHRGDLDQALARAARAEGELAARGQELGELNRRTLHVEGELDTTRADLRDREVKLAQARDRIGELETKLADFEDQILRAYQKLRSDDKIVDKAKRALAVALTLLDDRGAATSTANPQTTPAPRSPDEGST